MTLPGEIPVPLPEEGAIPRHPGRAGTAWNKARAVVLANATHCALCGEPLDFTAPPRSPRAPSVDHIVPIKAMAGMAMADQQRLATDPAALRAVHLGCNARRGAGRPTKRPVAHWSAPEW